MLSIERIESENYDLTEEEHEMESLGKLLSTRVVITGLKDEIKISDLKAEINYISYLIIKNPLVLKIEHKIHDPISNKKLTFIHKISGFKNQYMKVKLPDLKMTTNRSIQKEIQEERKNKIKNIINKKVKIDKILYSVPTNLRYFFATLNMNHDLRRTQPIIRVYDYKQHFLFERKWFSVQKSILALCRIISFFSEQIIIETSEFIPMAILLPKFPRPKHISKASNHPMDCMCELVNMDDCSEHIKNKLIG